MTKVLKNKKTLLSLLAGVLVVTVIIGAGTYAWLTNSATATPADANFYVARINVGASQIQQASYDFGSGDALNVQRLLQARDAEGWEALAWHRANTSTFDFMKNALGAWGDVIMVTPGTLAEAEFEITLNPPGNYTNVPVYFRVSAAQLVDITGTETMDVFGGNMTAVLPSGIEVQFKQVGDWFYCNTPLANHEDTNRTADIRMQFYIMGGSPMPPAAARFSTDSVAVDFIQANNNAVSFAPEWSHTELAGFFIDYRDIPGMENVYPNAVRP